LPERVGGNAKRTIAPFTARRSSNRDRLPRRLGGNRAEVEAAVGKATKMDADNRRRMLSLPRANRLQLVIR
jgi:hypothetical protein